jgi:hypothetical protein
LLTGISGPHIPTQFLCHAERWGLEEKEVWDMLGQTEW